MMTALRGTPIAALPVVGPFPANPTRRTICSAHISTLSASLGRIYLVICLVAGPLAACYSHVTCLGCAPCVASSHSSLTAKPTLPSVPFFPAWSILEVYKRSQREGAELAYPLKLFRGVHHEPLAS